MRSAVLAFSFGACLLAGGCETPNHRYLNGQPVADQSFAHIAAVPVNVGTVEIVNASGVARMPDDFVFALPEQVILYLSKKFAATGERGRLLVRIEEANVSKNHQDAKNGAAEMLGIGGEDRYVLFMRIALEHRGADGRILYGKVIGAEQRFSVSQRDSTAMRERAQLEAIEKLFGALDPKISQIISQDMRL